MSDISRSFDEQAALARVAGDADLLRESAQIYLDGYESMLQDVRAAVGAGDGAALKSAAHLLKGTVSTFEAVEATAAARGLEEIGASGDLAGAGAILETLETEVARLTADLTAYCGA